MGLIAFWLGKEQFGLFDKRLSYSKLSHARKLLLMPTSSGEQHLSSRILFPSVKQTDYCCETSETITTAGTERYAGRLTTLVHLPLPCLAHVALGGSGKEADILVAGKGC